MSIETAAAFPVIIDQSAKTKVADLLEKSGRTDLRLRLAVQSGGCSGLIYQFLFDDREFDGDIVHDFGEFEAVIDRMSVPYLEGSLLSFAETIEKQGFEIDNPNAQGSCACGDSFH